ncbi:MAG: FG-GAP-like repeat-containing protein [Candidatus Acidiferrales bacterium]
MKLPMGEGPILRRIFQISLLLGIAGTWLSGCYGNHAGLFPNDWNIPDSPAARVQSTTSANVDQSAVPLEVPINSGNPAQLKLAPLLGNLPALSVPPALVGGLQRQADCSLTYFDFSYASDSATVSVTPNAQIPHYEKALHDSASLNTTPDQFLAGCADPNQGITSRPFLFLGTGKNGRELVAVPGTSGVVTSGLKSDGTFTQPTTQATPIASISLLSGDLNKDGNADLVSINSNAAQSSVTVFLGNDDGSYQPGIDYALPGANAQYGVLDDLNGDGILDLLVSSDSPTFAFSIFIGNGDGTFQPPQTFTPTHTSLHYHDAFITADVNGDGIKDIVTVQAQIFLGKGDGVTFTQMSQAAFAPINTATNHFAPSIVAADFNKDGKLDLATDDGSTIRTYLGNGDGTFSAGPAYPTIPNYGFLVATDLDGDGNIDLWTGYGGNGVYGGDAYLPNAAYALMGNGDGTFQGVPGLPPGDSNYAAGKLPAVTKPVKNTSQTLTLSAPSPGKVTVVAGQNSPPFTVTASSPSATPQNVTFACSGLPVLATCTFQPDPAVLTAAQNSAPVSVTIGTTANSVVPPAHRFLPPSDWMKLQWLLVFGLLASSIILFRARRRKLGWLVAACMLLAVLTPLDGCTGGSSSSTTTFTGTPPGTYAVTVMGLGAETANTPSTLTLTVTSP